MSALGCPNEHEPMVDWVGDTPFLHGERDECQGCFCGAPYYFHCDGWLDSNLAHATIARSSPSAARPGSDSTEGDAS